MKHTKELAERIIGQLECRANAPFRLVGSVATKGFSHHDIDLVWDTTRDREDFELFELIMHDMGFEMAGNNSHGETWRRGDGCQLDLWFEDEEY